MNFGEMLIDVTNSVSQINLLSSRPWSFCVPLTLLALIILAAVYFARVKIR